MKTELDIKLQEIAQKNWEQFVNLIGEDRIVRAKICLLRQKNFSLTQIERKLDVSRMQARANCGACDA